MILIPPVKEQVIVDAMLTCILRYLGALFHCPLRPKYPLPDFLFAIKKIYYFQRLVVFLSPTKLDTTIKNAITIKEENKPNAAKQPAISPEFASAVFAKVEKVPKLLPILS